MTYLAAICALQIVVIAALILDRRIERQEVAAERRDLLQRIQAPQVAVAKDWNDTLAAESPRAVSVDEDEDYWVTKEDLADALARAELEGDRQDRATMNRQTYGGD